MKKGFIFAGTIALITLASLCLLLLIPYIGDRALPPLLAQLPFDEKQVSITRITPWQSVGHFNISQKGSRFSCARFEIHYSPNKLFKGGINTLILEGATFNLAAELFSSQQKSQTKESGFDKIFDNLSATIDTIVLNNTTIIFNMGDSVVRKLHINGEIEISTDKQDNNKHKLHNIKTHLAIDGDISAIIKAKMFNNEANYTVQSDIDFPDTGFLQKWGLPKSSGKLNSLSKVVLNKESLNVNYIETELTGNSFTIYEPNFNLTLAKENRPHATLKGSLDNLEYSVTDILLSTSDIETNLTASGALNSITLDTTGTATIKNQFFPEESTVSFKKNGQHFNLKSVTEKITLPSSETFFHSPIELTIDGSSDPEKTLAKVSLLIREANIPEQNIKLQNINFEQDIALKENALSKTAGKFKIGKIHFKNVNSASITGETSLNESGLNVKTALTTPYHKKLKVDCTANYQFNNKDTPGLNCELGKTLISEKNIPKFIELPQNLTFSSEIAAQLALSLNKGLQGSLDTQVANTTIQSGDKVTISGLTTKLSLPNLPTQHSAPSQSLKIENITVGAIELTNASIDYRLEDFNTLFIEKSRLNWCGGKVDSGAIRLIADKTDYNLTLYCDRIGFTDLLAQLGMPNAEGKGTLNGKLPISLKDSNLQFDDGFLFSSPGDNGIVRFTNTDAIKNNFGANIETSYLSYSMSALENFEYNWATLSFNSTGDDLTISMQLDGKPASPLPFTYKNGQIVPSENGTGIQHPLHMDVNFHLPLNDLFHYGKNIQSLMETM